MRRTSKEGEAHLYAYELGSHRETNCGPLGGYDISHDQKKMLISKNGQYGIIDLPKGPAEITKALDLSEMEVKLDRHAEWKQIFNECWRQMRDFFYDPGMHGVDWPAVRKKYEVLLPYVEHRADLTYLIGEMISELNAGHCYVGGGDVPQIKRIPMGLLGAELKRQPETKYYQIAKILHGANWSPKLRSPLTEVGVDVKEGEYIVAINGQPTNEVNNIFELLQNTPGRQITLKVNAQPSTRERGPWW